MSNQEVVPPTTETNAVPASTGESAEKTDTGTTSWFSTEAPESETGKEEVVEEATPATTEDATDASTNDEDGEDTEQVSETEKKPGKGFEKRIERFNRRLAEKDQMIEVLLQKVSGNTATAPATPAVQQIAEPKLADFNGDVEAFTTARVKYGVQQALLVQAMQAQREKVAQSYTQKEVEFKKTATDYADVMQDLQEDYRTDNRAGREFNEALVESDMGPQMYYYLGTHREELERILNLPPTRQLVEIGKLDLKLSAAGAGKSKAPPKVSKAPAPTTSEKGSPPAVLKLTDPNISQKDYRLARMANRRKM